jgi:hypothetical protein
MGAKRQRLAEFRSGGFGLSNGDRQTFIFGDCRRQLE